MSFVKGRRYERQFFAPANILINLPDKVVTFAEEEVERNRTKFERTKRLSVPVSCPDFIDRLVGNLIFTVQTQIYRVL